MSVRVRFAPSPTGGLHIGGLRTALYNYLFAKKNGGEFILRIEDTDRTRFVDSAEQYIIDALNWINISPDEGPQQGGEYGPYRQSERKELYHKYVQQLLDEGKAYYAFDSPEELDKMRDRLKEAKADNQQYNYESRKEMRNSLTLSESETKTLLENGTAYVIRMNIPKDEEVVLHDIIRGEVRVKTATLDDKILIKSDGMPTYHMANIVDDHLMKITHVIRGEEWLPSAPLHVLLYRLLGWENSMPTFAHLPLLLKPEGNGKLSKRDADKGGFPIFPMTWQAPQSEDASIGFKESGYQADAFTNFLAFLGWNPGTEDEIFNLAQLEQAFSLDRVNKAGAKFDINKAQWYNQQYLKNKDSKELAQQLISDVEANGLNCSEELAISICDLLKERISFPSELWNDNKFFFMLPESYDEKTARKKWSTEAVTVLTTLKENLVGKESLTGDEIHHEIEQILNENNIGFGKVMQPIRLAMTGKPGGPDLMPLMALLGAKEIGKRIDIAIEKLASNLKA